MKILAFHLPQYYEFEENNKWWGEGFTDWVNVKKAQPRFRGHYQPHIPYENNYYDMTDVKTLNWQAKLASDYGIYGFCYYHYWFDGKLLLEKPCELLLAHPEINENYCFCWANEPWTRSWDGGNKDVIMPQRYGDESDWETHFQYLLDFFRDERYIKIDNKPFFVIYRTDDIDNCDKMIEYWQMRCKDVGFDGIYIVEEVNSFQLNPVCQNSEAVLEFEPMYTNHVKDSLLLWIERMTSVVVGRLLHKNYKKRSYDLTWRAILRRKHTSDSLGGGRRFI